MKKRLSLLLCMVMLFTTLATSAQAVTVHKKMSWKQLDKASTLEEPYKDYESVFDKTQEKYLFSEFEKDLFTLRDQYPDLMKLDIIGYSELGRPLYVVILGKDTAPNRMVVMATTHAREYTGTQLSVLQIEYYLHNYYGTIEGERICDLLERCQFYFVPMHNPDGAMLTMTGLDSLDEPGLTVTPEDKAEIEKFLISQLEPMHDYCENDTHYHDSDAEFYSDNPDPERDDAFLYWKNNIRGIDLHYSMYTPWMINVWKEGTWYYESIESHFTAPNWQNFAGANVTDGIGLSSENRAMRDFVNKIKPNLFISYHTASNYVQWNYGYGRLPNGTELRANAQDISNKAGALLGFGTVNGNNPHIGHPGWFLKNSTEYMDTCGYAATIELASRAYLDSTPQVDGRPYTDAPPIKVIQVTDDVETVKGSKRPSLWTTGRFFPLALSQYIMDNQKIDAVGPLNGDSKEDTKVTSILGAPVTTPAAADVLDFGTIQMPRAGKAAIIPGDILTNRLTPVLYNADFSETVDSVEINGTTKVCFAYTDKRGTEIRATFTAEPVEAISAAAGVSLKMDISSGNSSAPDSPALLHGAAETGTVTLAEHKAALTPADFTVAEGYTVALYTDNTYATPAESIALAVGENTVCAAVSNAQGNKAYYTLQIVNPEAPPAPAEPVVEPGSAGISPAVIGIGAAVVVAAVVIGVVASKKRKK